jgi:hypothetical protein
MPVKNRPDLKIEWLLETGPSASWPFAFCRTRRSSGIVRRTNRA